MIASLVVVGVLASAPASTPASAADLARLSWLAGCWSRTNTRRIVEEQWMAPAAGLMLGAGRTRNVADGALAELEQVRIESRGDTLVFVAKPSRQPEATFTAVAVTDSMVVFENLAHDYPQRVGYRLVHADSVAAFIDGTNDGKPRKVEFPYRRVSCPNPR
jgi:hypothetical protein